MTSQSAKTSNGHSRTSQAGPTNSTHDRGDQRRPGAEPAADVGEQRRTPVAASTSRQQPPVRGSADPIPNGADQQLLERDREHADVLVVRPQEVPRREPPAFSRKDPRPEVQRPCRSPASRTAEAPSATLGRAIAGLRPQPSHGRASVLACRQILTGLRRISARRCHGCATGSRGMLSSVVESPGAPSVRHRVARGREAAQAEGGMGARLDFDPGRRRVRSPARAGAPPEHSLGGSPPAWMRRPAEVLVEIGSAWPSTMSACRLPPAGAPSSSAGV